MKTKKLWALLIAAALALSLVLTGCSGKNQSLAQVILNLLDGQYRNVSVELDPDLEAKLRQAAGEGETEEEIRAALEKLLGGGIRFQLLGEGQKGDSAWSLVIYPGNDPDAAARSAYLDWNKVFSSLPGDGRYAAGLAMIETENGYAILVRATVEKAGSRDDDDDEPGYTKTGDNSYTVNTPDGLQNLFTESTSDTDVQAARNKNFEGVTIKLDPGETYTVTKQLTGTFKGTLTSSSGKATIELKSGNGLFGRIGEDSGTSGSNGKVENITFKVEANITNTYTNSSSNIYSGAVAGINNGTITGCKVTINSDKSIHADSSDGIAYAGGIVGQNNGTITSCTVTGGAITATDASFAYAGGIAGCNLNFNGGTIDGNCIVENTSVTATGSSHAYAGGLVGDNNDINTEVNGTYRGTGTITATAANGSAHAGGLAGWNYGTVTGSYTGTSTEITATGTAEARAGGLVGYNYGSNAEVNGTYTGSGTITATAANGYANAGGIAGLNSSGTVTATYSGSSTITATAEGTTNSDAYAGGLVGFNNGGTVDGTYTGTNIIKATAGDDEASVPYTYNGTTYYTATDLTVSTESTFGAYAGTKCGRDSNGHPSSHTTTST